MSLFALEKHKIIYLQFFYTIVTKISCVFEKRVYNIIDLKNNGTKRKADSKAKIKAERYDVRRSRNAS